MAARHPEPFRRKQTDCFYVQVGAKQIRLAKDKDEAYRLYHELMARQAETHAAPQPAPLISPSSSSTTSWDG